MGSPQEEVDKDAIHETYRRNLARLGLIKMKFRKPIQGELPEFDEKIGMMNARGYSITSLGRLLLRSIAQGKED